MRRKEAKVLHASADWTEHHLPEIHAVSLDVSGSSTKLPTLAYPIGTPITEAEVWIQLRPV
jgi:hypothetical protein